MQLYIGIDPGLTGAIAIIDKAGKILSLQDTPVMVVKKSKGSKTIYLDAEMAVILDNLTDKTTLRGGTIAKNPSSVVMVGLENVHSMPKEGVTASFSMGVGVGLWRGILAALQLPVTFIAPVTWKQAMGIPAGSDKAVSIVRARQLFPSADLHRKKDHGRADALLIAEYVRRNNP